MKEKYYRKSTFIGVLDAVEFWRNRALKAEAKLAEITNKGANDE